MSNEEYFWYWKGKLATKENLTDKDIEDIGKAFESLHKEIKLLGNRDYFISPYDDILGG
jgi:hypothetical protein